MRPSPPAPDLSKNSRDLGSLEEVSAAPTRPSEVLPVDSCLGFCWCPVSPMVCVGLLDHCWSRPWRVTPLNVSYQRASKTLVPKVLDFVSSFLQMHHHHWSPRKSKDAGFRGFWHLYCESTQQCFFHFLDPYLTDNILVLACLRPKHLIMLTFSKMTVGLCMDPIKERLTK